MRPSKNESPWVGLPVSMILELLAANMTPEEILADYPDLEREDISACVAFAARLSSVHRILPLAA